MIYTMCSPDTIVSSRSYWIFGQANPYIHGMDIHSVSGESDSIAEIILHTSSGWPMLTPNEYLFHVRWDGSGERSRNWRMERCWWFDVDLCIYKSTYSTIFRICSLAQPHRLIRSYHILILECPSGWPMFTLTEYSLWIRLIRWYDIYYVFAWYDSIVEIILDIQSGESVHTQNEYSFCVRRIW